MKLKHGVDFFSPHPRLVEVVTIADRIHRELTSRDLEVTSGRRRKKLGSFHSPRRSIPFRAFDARIWYLRRLEKAQEYKLLLLSEAPSSVGLQVIIEPDDLTVEEIVARGGLDKVAPHIHHELDPTNLAGLEWERVD